MKSPIISVSQLLRFVKSLVDEQKQLSDVMVRGEISDVAYRSISGHIYFSLVENEMTIRCVMFSKYAGRLSSFPKSGSMVLLRGAVSVYERDGSVQVIAYDIQELGSGIVKKTTDDIKKKLAAEGLFSQERKRVFPSFPKVVGVITSPDGAAVKDITATFKLHNPLVKLIIYPAIMQGNEAANSMISSLKFMQEESLCESCVIARGGGSADDLSAFNSEELARTVAACSIPVVSAVGHEIDYTIIDLVADARAATPTAACKVLSKSISDFYDSIYMKQQQMEKYISIKILAERRKISSLKNVLEAHSPEVRLNNYIEKNRYLLDALHYKIQTKLTKKQAKVESLIEQLELINPIQLLKKGYSISLNNGSVVDSITAVQPGESIVTRVSDGAIISTVTDICKEE